MHKGYQKVVWSLKLGGHWGRFFFVFLLLFDEFYFSELRLKLFCESTPHVILPHLLCTLLGVVKYVF